MECFDTQRDASERSAMNVLQGNSYFGGVLKHRMHISICGHLKRIKNKWAAILATLAASVYQIVKEPRVQGSENMLIEQDYQDVGGCTIFMTNHLYDNRLFG
jgi:hypothetical protein